MNYFMREIKKFDFEEFMRGSRKLIEHKTDKYVTYTKEGEMFNLHSLKGGYKLLEREGVLELFDKSNEKISCIVYRFGNFCEKGDYCYLNLASPRDLSNEYLKTLFDKLESLCIKKNINKIYLRVGETNENAITVFRYLGFNYIGYENDFDFFRGRIKMEKIL